MRKDRDSEHVAPGVAAEAPSSQVRSWRGRYRHGVALAATLIGVVLAIAACGGSSSTVAQSASTPSSAGGSATHGVTPALEAALLKFSQCVRSHGVPDFPDPNGQGVFSPSKISSLAGTPQFQAAVQKCKPDLPATATVPSVQAQKNLLKFSQCVRAHGVPNFPDLGGPNSSLPSSINPKSPQVQNAVLACKPLLAGTGSSGL